MMFEVFPHAFLKFRRSLLTSGRQEVLSSPREQVACPDLGQLLVLQTLAGEEPWDALAAPLLAEAMARNVMWVEREVHGAGSGGARKVADVLGRNSFPWGQKSLLRCFEDTSCHYKNVRTVSTLHKAFLPRGT